MTDPKRLLELDGSPATEFERHLLEAVVHEEPSAALTERMLESTLAASAGAAAGGAGWGAGALLLAGALTAGAVGGWALWTRTPSPTEGVTSLPLVDSVSSRPSADLDEQASFEKRGAFEKQSVLGKQEALAKENTSEEPSEPSAPHPFLGQEELVRPHSTTASNPKGTGHSKAASEDKGAHGTPSSLREEVRLLDEARGALRGGDSATALSVLARYERAFPKGALRKEATLLWQRAQEGSTARRVAP